MGAMIATEIAVSLCQDVRGEGEDGDAVLDLTWALRRCS